MLRGEGLLRKIRFPFMSADFLVREARDLLPESAGLEVLVLEADYSSTWLRISGKELTCGILMPKCWCRDAEGE